MISIIGPSIAGGAPIVQTPGSGDIPPTFDEAFMLGVPALAGYGSDYGWIDEATFTDGSINDITDNGDGTADITVNSAGTPLVTMVYECPVLNPFDPAQARIVLDWTVVARFVSQAAGTDFRIGAGLIYTTDPPGTLNGTLFARAVDADFAGIVYADKTVIVSFYTLSVAANRKGRWRKIYAGVPSEATANAAGNTDVILNNSHIAGERSVAGQFDQLASGGVLQAPNAPVGNIGIESTDYNNVTQLLANYSRAYVFVQAKSFGVAGDIVFRLPWFQGGLGSSVP